MFDANISARSYVHIMRKIMLILREVMFISGFKDYFQSVLRSYSTLMFISSVSSHSMECELMLLVSNHILYLEAFRIPFPTASLLITASKLFHQVI